MFWHNCENGRKSSQHVRNQAQMAWIWICTWTARAPKYVGFVGCRRIARLAHLFCESVRNVISLHTRVLDCFSAFLCVKCSCEWIWLGSCAASTINIEMLDANMCDFCDVSRSAIISILDVAHLFALIEGAARDEPTFPLHFSFKFRRGDKVYVAGKKAYGYWSDPAAINTNNSNTFLRHNTGMPTAANY